MTEGQIGLYMSFALEIDQMVETHFMACEILPYVQEVLSIFIYGDVIFKWTKPFCTCQNTRTACRVRTHDRSRGGPPSGRTPLCSRYPYTIEVNRFTHKYVYH